MAKLFPFYYFTIFGKKSSYDFRGTTWSPFLSVSYISEDKHLNQNELIQGE